MIHNSYYGATRIQTDTAENSSVISFFFFALSLSLKMIFLFTLSNSNNIYLSWRSIKIQMVSQSKASSKPQSQHWHLLLKGEEKCGYSTFLSRHILKRCNSIVNRGHKCVSKSLWTYDGFKQ